MLVKELVGFPEEVAIREVVGDRTLVFEVRMNPTDIGKIIGKSGRSITATRTLVSATGVKNDKRVMIEII